MESGKTVNNWKTRRICCLKHDDIISICFSLVSRGCVPFGQHPVSHSCAEGTNIQLVGTSFADMANGIEKKTTVIVSPYSELLTNLRALQETEHGCFFSWLAYRPFCLPALLRSLLVGCNLVRRVFWPLGQRDRVGTSYMIIIVYRDVFPLWYTCLWYCLSALVCLSYLAYLCVLGCLSVLQATQDTQATKDTQVSQVPLAQARQETQVDQDTHKQVYHKGNRSRYTIIILYEVPTLRWRCPADQKARRLWVPDWIGCKPESLEQRKLRRIVFFTSIPITWRYHFIRSRWIV